MKVTLFAAAAAVGCVLSAPTPASPKAQYWWKYPSSDCPYVDVGHVSDKTIPALESACLNTTGCVAFNTDGFLKNSSCSGAIVGGEPCDLYILHDTPQPLYTNFPPIVPAPLSFTNGSTILAVNSVGFNFNAPNPFPDLDNALVRYAQRTFPHKTSSSTTGLAKLVVTVNNVSVPLQLGVDESYTLDIPADGSAATLNAETVYGAYHGLETFSQLVVFNFDTESYEIDFAPWHIQDAPRFMHRGLLIDSSRHFEPVPTIKAVIDSLTYAKLNTLHWHIVDEQSFPFDSPSYPRLAQYGAYSKQERYTVNDVAEVVEYARARGVRVMPEVDTPGHAAAMCNGYPDICPSPTCPMPLNPATNATFELLDGLFRDMTGGSRGSGLFPDNFFHLGSDEVNTNCWTSTPSIVAWLKSKNFTADDAYMYFVSQTHSIINSQGRDAVYWEEVFDHFGSKLASNTVIHIWLSAGTLPKVTGAGYRALFSPDATWYLDNLSNTWETFYETEPTQNVPVDQQHLILGGETCMWGETVDTSDIQQTIWPRSAAAAERMWSPLSALNDTAAALPRMAAFRCLLNRRGVAAAPLMNKGARSAPPGPGGCYVQ